MSSKSIVLFGDCKRNSCIIQSVFFFFFSLSFPFRIIKVSWVLCPISRDPTLIMLSLPLQCQTPHPAVRLALRDLELVACLGVKKCMAFSRFWYRNESPANHSTHIRNNTKRMEFLFLRNQKKRSHFYEINQNDQIFFRSKRKKIKISMLTWQIPRLCRVDIELLYETWGDSWRWARH